MGNIDYKVIKKRNNIFEYAIHAKFLIVDAYLFLFHDIDVQLHVLDTHSSLTIVTIVLVRHAVDSSFNNEKVLLLTSPAYVVS